MNSTLIRHKCGYCGWLFGLNTDFIQHDCFKNYVEDVDRINVDENYVVTILHANSQGSLDNKSRDEVDELLISAVQGKLALYDHRIPAVDRTLLRKNVLWAEVSNILGGILSPDESKARWKYLRDNFIKARKKVRAYIPSGSAASAAAGSKTKFKFYDAMRFLEDSLSTRPTASSLQGISCEGTVDGACQEKDDIPYEDTEEMMNDVSSETSNENAGRAYLLSRPLVQPTCSVQTSTNGTRRASSVGTASLETPPYTTKTSSTPRLAMIGSKQSPQGSADAGSMPKIGRPTKKHKTDTDLQAAFIEALKEPPQSPALQPVDGFLVRLGEGLKRLPYRQRARLEIKFLTQLADEEELSTGLDTDDESQYLRM